MRGSLTLILVAAVLSMGSRCPTDPSPPPCSIVQEPVPVQVTQADVDRAHDEGFEEGQASAPLCDVRVNDREVQDDLRWDLCRTVETHIYSRGPSLPDKDRLWRELRLKMVCR